MNSSAEAALSVLPPTVLVFITGAVIHFLYKSLKFLVEKTYQEMMDNHDEVKKALSNLKEHLIVIERDVYEIKMQLNSFVTIEKHYSTVKVVNNDVSDMRERVARLESRRHDP